MALREKAAFIFIVRLFLTLGILIAIIGFAGLGGFLNRCRGGFINFGEFLDYWPAHILSRQIFSFSTGLLVVSSEITGLLVVKSLLVKNYYIIEMAKSTSLVS